MRYRKEGIVKTTRLLIDAISGTDIKGMTLLDIGGGLGGIQHVLLAGGAARAISVDASSAYVKAAKEEAKRRELDDRISFLHGDFVDLADEVSQADIVTLDRVLCCYDDMLALVKLSAAKAQKKYGLVFPRDLWSFRLILPVANFFIALTGSPFRIYIHKTEQVEKILQEQGLVKLYQKNAGFWQIMVYNRN
jgi:2-polyprenyl-3-methyl-5-hydroxy-6-metoxy-1,4-benzoquinol methylase